MTKEPVEDISGVENLDVGVDDHIRADASQVRN